MNSSGNFAVDSNGSVNDNSAPTSEASIALLPTYRRTSCNTPSASPPDILPWLALADLRARVRWYPAPYLFFKNTGDPTQASFPADMMAMRSHSRSASSRKCVVSMIDDVAARLRITSHVKRREYGSMPDVGSSRNTTDGFPMKEIASDSFRFWPPESRPVL